MSTFRATKPFGVSSMATVATATLTRPIIFFGTEKFSLFGLQALIDADYPIAAVVTKPDMKKGRGKSLSAPDVKLLAEKHNIPVLQPTKLTEITEFITPLQPVVGVLVSFGRILPQSIIDLFEPGIINVHPSLLPIYRGPSPIETAILNNDAVTGVTIMQLSAQMDAGPLYAQETLDLDEYRDKAGADFTKETLYTSLGLLGAELLVKTLPGIVSGDLSPLSQDDTKATYCHLITKQDGAIDWHKPADQLEREIIAYAGWPGSRTTLETIDVTITEGYSVYPVEEESGDPGTLHANTALNKEDPAYPLLYVTAGKDEHGKTTYLKVARLKPAGKKELSDREFINGYRQLL